MDENQLNQTAPENQSEEQPAEEKKHKLLEFREEEKKPLLTAQVKEKIRKELREWVVSLSVALVAVFLIRSFLFTIIRVDGPSMSDTLLNGDRLMVTVLDMKLHGPDRFDVIICKYPGKNDQYVKRVIGLPGDTIEVKSGVLYVNGEAIEEPFLSDSRTVRFDKPSNSFGPIVIPEGEYFVMGDNRDNSNDSRAVGTITEDMVIGKVRFVFWPLSHIGVVEGSEVYAE
ncbi:MAG: signal peptidase I [Clostridia bacterium]|nr:signal peptidase I [Clostridia bacterium]